MRQLTSVPQPCHNLAIKAALVVSLGLFVLLSGCGGAPTSETDPSVEYLIPTLQESASNSALSFDIEQCWPLTGESTPGGKFTVALVDSVRPSQAPVPANTAERMVFSLLYETLVKVSCDGSLKPGLAENWACTDDGTTWVFRIREDAVLWDGTRITASLIKKAWARNQNIPAAKDHVSPWAWLNATSKSVKVIDGQRLAIQLPESQLDFPLLLAHPATSVAIKRPGWLWPIGSGPGRLQASTPAPLPDLNIMPNIHHPNSPKWKNLRFLVKPGLDSRDLIVFEPDLFVVENIPAANFFREAPGFRVDSLPWQRLYLLVCTPKQNPDGSGRWINPVVNLDRSADLNDVATRPWSHLIYPATRALDCPQLTGPIHRSIFRMSSNFETVNWPDKNTLLFCLDDTGSQELAMRLAALGDAAIKVQGVSLTELNTALENQSPGAFILAIDRHYPSGCLQLASLLGRATWLQKAASTNFHRDLARAAMEKELPITCALTHSGIITPLILTHPYLVSKGNLAGLELEFDGTINLINLGRTE